MTADNESLGTIEHHAGTFTVCMQRSLARPPAEVWAMLTEPAKLVDWLAPGEIELRVGGRAKLDFGDSGIVVDSPVTACEPQRLLEYAWSGPDEPLRPVRWSLQPEQGGTRLELRLSLPDGEDVARSAAGWEAHLQMLLAAIEGVPIKFPFERFQSSRQAYNDIVSAIKA
jgi:uncharacterized protein YndB with AHSA1/START domain